MMKSSAFAARVLPLGSSDLEDVAVLQPEGWGDILGSIRFYCSSEFCYPLKATVNDKLVGVGTAIIHRSTAWLAHIIVHKDYRNAGIGTTITQALIDLVSKTNCQTMLLIATTLGEPVYRKLGFTVDTQYVFFDHGNLPEPANPGNIVLFQEQYRDALMEFDKYVSGERREKLLSTHLRDTKLFLDNGDLKGFYIPTLGEGLIIANDPHAGTELMKHKHRINNIFCIPVMNEFGINFLEQHGYKKLREASRMFLGKKITWNARHIYGRIGGNLG